MELVESVVDKHLFNLNTIAKIQKNKKLSTCKEFVNIDDEGLWGSINRTLNRDNRDKTVGVVTQTVDSLIIVVELLMDSKYLADAKPRDDTDTTVLGPRDRRISLVKKIYNSLLLSITGFENLCETYENDQNVLAKLKPTLGRINDCTSRTFRFLTSVGEALLAVPHKAL